MKRLLKFIVLSIATAFVYTEAWMLLNSGVLVLTGAEWSLRELCTGIAAFGVAWLVHRYARVPPLALCCVAGVIPVFAVWLAVRRNLMWHDITDGMRRDLLLPFAIAAAMLPAAFLLLRHWPANKVLQDDAPGARLSTTLGTRTCDMNKVACSKCGVMVLARTAMGNDGKCVPCANGTRERMEEDRRRYREERERDKTDPERTYWRALVQRVHETDTGFEGLSEAEKRYFAVCCLGGEIYNGGFHQFFANSSGSYFEYAVAGLEDLRAERTL